MRILHIDSEKGFGGGQRQVIFLIRELKKEEKITQALAASPGSEIEKHVLAMNVSVLPLEQRNDADIFSAMRLAKYAKEFQPDIIHTHTARSLSMTWLARTILRMGRPPVIINTRRVAFPLKGPMARSKYRNGADFHIAISNACHDQIVQAGVSPQRTAIIPDGIEIPESINREETRKKLIALTGFEERNLIIGASGNLFPVKRFDWLVDAVSMARKDVPNVRLVLFGDGECRREIENIIKKSGQDEAIHIAGHVDRPERFFAGLDIFAMPSRDEGLGTSLIDAMARGVPLLASNTSGIKDVVQENVNGLMFDPDSPDDLVAKLSMLAGNAELRRSLSDKGPAIAAEKFNITDISRKILEYYKACVGREGE